MSVSVSVRGECECERGDGMTHLVVWVEIMKFLWRVEGKMGLVQTHGQIEWLLLVLCSPNVGNGVGRHVGILKVNMVNI